MVPVNEVDERGPAAPDRPQPAAGLERAARPRSTSRGSISASGRAATSSSAPGRTSSTTRPGDRCRRRRRHRRRAGPATTGIKLDTTLMRLLFALRFRDLDLLISDQVTADSQLLFHRSLAERLPRIAPFLRYDKDPYIVVDDDRPARLRPGRVHDVRPVPERPVVRPGRRSAATGLGGETVQLHPQQRQDHGRRVRRDDALLRQPTRPIRSSGRTQGVFPTLFKPLSADARRPPARTCASRRSSSTSRPGCSGGTT